MGIISYFSYPYWCLSPCMPNSGEQISNQIVTAKSQIFGKKRLQPQASNLKFQSQSDQIKCQIFEPKSQIPLQILYSMARSQSCKTATSDFSTAVYTCLTLNRLTNSEAYHTTLLCIFHLRSDTTTYASQNSLIAERGDT